MYFGLFFIVVLFELLRKRDFTIDFLSIFNFFFSLYYIFVPIVFHIHSTSEWVYMSRYSEAADSLYLYFSIMISLVLVNVFYIIFNVRSKWEGVLRVNNKRFIRFIVFGLFMGCLLIYLKSIGYGGIVKFAMSGYLSRAGEIDGGVFDYVTPFVKVIVPFFFIFVAFFVSFPSLRNFVILTIAASFYGAWAMSTGGRGNLILTLLPVFFIYVNSKGINARVIALACTLAAIGLAVIAYGRSFFYALALSNAGAGDFFSLFMKNQESFSGQGADPLVAIFRHFDHSLVSAFLILEDLDKYGGFRYIFDYPRVVLDALPGLSVVGGGLDAINASIPAQINKELIGLSDGYVPVGWVGLMLLNGGVIFLAIASSVSGLVGGKLSSLIVSLEIPGKCGIYIFFAFFWFWFFFHTDPLNLIIPMVSYYIFIFFFLYLIKFRRYRIVG